MSVAILLRLVPQALNEGRVAGHAEVVDTGESLVFKDQEEMLAFLRRAGTADAQDRGGHDDRTAAFDSSVGA